MTTKDLFDPESEFLLIVATVCTCQFIKPANSSTIFKAWTISRIPRWRALTSGRRRGNSFINYYETWFNWSCCMCFINSYALHDSSFYKFIAIVRIYRLHLTIVIFRFDLYKSVNAVIKSINNFISFEKNWLYHNFFLF